MTKQISIAFIWHMHQPSYKDTKSGLYLMPWVRLHAIKDYLDMLYLMGEFPNIKQTFNLVPLLLEQIEDYANNNAHDIHSKFTVSDVEIFSNEDKEYVLSNFFAANYEHQIQPNSRYLELYNKYFAKNGTIEDFSKQDISDLMALFNLVWFDPSFVEKNSEIKELVVKGKNYTQQDRIKIIELQREIMRKIIPAYKKAWNDNKIEISTSPYYHALLPLMINQESAKELTPNITLPEISSSLKAFAKMQIEKGIAKTEQLFGKKPKGIWLPELCISSDTLKLLSEFDINWTIADESILSKTLKKDFTRNYRGIMEDPFDVSIPYTYKSENKNYDVIFRNSMLSNLISFEYSNYNSITAANDLYERIKVAQDKLEISPVDKHLIVIAIDGENCWENYENDGIEFLKAIYTLLNNDKSIDVTTVSEYLQHSNIKQEISSLNAGSWINANFDMWTGDPIKNMAWNYLNKTKNDFEETVKNYDYPENVINKATEELLTAQGSDWFWWYGEPNNSGSDDIFDYLFRLHLQNVYRLLDINIPAYLDIPLEVFIGKPSKKPKSLIKPVIDGKIHEKDNWTNAGCIEIPQSPTLTNKMLDRIYFGNDEKNIYFRFDFNKFFTDKLKNNAGYPNEIFIYFAKKKSDTYSSIRLRNKNESVPQILKYGYTHEIQVPINKDRILPVIFSETIENSLWKVNLVHNINYFHSDILEMQIPFDDLKMVQGDGVYIIFVSCKANIIHQILPLDNSIYLERP